MSFYPYGDEITSSAPDQLKFATYTRDSYTGLDYADQRFYASTYGRFNTADRKAGDPSDPASMNRYTYVAGDPVNRMDPQGTDWVYVGGAWCSTLDAGGGCYDPGYGDPASGGGGDNPCPNFDPNIILALEQSSLGPTLEAQAAAMGCTGYSAPIITVSTDSDPCPGIAGQIWNTITGQGMPGGKSLLLRVVQQITGSQAGFAGHQEQIDGYRKRLRNLSFKWKNNDCDDPDDPPYGTNQWIAQTSAKVLQQYQQKYLQYMQDLSEGVAGIAAAFAVGQQIIDYVGALAAELGEGLPEFLPVI
jgi:RHS repeat-associated protein